jgi:radical SAM protein with 4Fe4S-binding SPASM domain
MPRATRRRLPKSEGAKPRYVVWEITLRCDQPCAHCGSRAGTARQKELSTEEALAVCQQLIALDTKEVTLIGGEAYLRKDAVQLIEALSKGGVTVTMQTGGRAMTKARAQTFKDAGLYALGVSVDGPEAIHDRLRNNKGSFAAAMRALEAAREIGIPTASNMQINRLSADHLWETSQALRERHVRVWRGQLTVPMGNAADHEEWILEPWRIVPVIDTLAAIQVDAVKNPRPHEHPHPQRTFDVMAGNNIGYYGPHEMLLRSHPGGLATHWTGCGAGIATMSIESDGTLKACPSLPTAPYRSGNVLDMPIATAWEEQPNMRFARDRDGSELWGFCKTCDYASTCNAGCNFTAHSTMGRRGNQPWCYHRATTMARNGKRERLVQVERAAGVPYDFGRFEIVEEDIEI